jgi:imidazolonepropionase-like amidohydrolase
MENLLGVIKSGAYADLIIVDGDPLKELGLLCNDGESISGVISNGKFIKKEFKLSNNL